MDSWRDYSQFEFNQLMRGYYKEFGGRKCVHTPKEMMLYRLCVVFTFGVVVGFIINHI